MARLANVVRRAGTYHFRRVVPSHLRARLERCELVRSLDTQAAPAAKLRADLLCRTSERPFVAAAEPMLSPDLLARLVRDFHDLNLTLNDHQRLLDGPLTDEGHAAGVAHLDTLLCELRQALARNRFDDEIIAFAAAVAMRRNGLAPEELGSGEENQIRQAFLRAGIDLLQDLRARCDGDFSCEPRDRLPRARAASEAPTSTITASAPAKAPAPAPWAVPVAEPPVVPQPEPPLSEIGRAFRHE